MKGLGILTEQGQEAVKKNSKALQYISYKYRLEYVEFKDENPCPIDGFFLGEGRVHTAFEIKTRNGYIENNQFVFRDQRYDTFLISHNKLQNGFNVSFALNLPFVLIAAFDIYIYIWLINQKLLQEVERKITQTNYDVNGGIAFRPNAFLPLSKARIKLSYEE